jgi:hypothetical protein
MELCFVLHHRDMSQWHRTSQWQLQWRSCKKYFSHNIVIAFVKKNQCATLLSRIIKMFSNCCWEHSSEFRETWREVEMATSGVEECPWRAVTDPLYPCAEGHSAAASVSILLNDPQPWIVYWPGCSWKKLNISQEKARIENWWLFTQCSKWRPY